MTNFDNSSESSFELKEEDQTTTHFTKKFRKKSVFSEKRSLPETKLIENFCRDLCKNFISQNLSDIIFGYLALEMDSSVKLLMIEILNLTNVSKFKVTHIELIFKFMQEVQDFTKGQNELVYGNSLLLLTKILVCSSFGSNFLKSFGQDWIFELMQMMVKNSQRKLKDNSPEMFERNILNCCFLHFFSNLSSLISKLEVDRGKLLNYSLSILQAEMGLDSQASPPLDIERSFVGRDIYNLDVFLSESQPTTFQFFRLLHLMGERVEFKNFQKDHYQKNLMISQRELYKSCFKNIQTLAQKEIANFSKKVVGSGSQSSDQSIFLDFFNRR